MADVTDGFTQDDVELILAAQVVDWDEYNRSDAVVEKRKHALARERLAARLAAHIAKKEQP